MWNGLSTQVFVHVREKYDEVGETIAERDNDCQCMINRAFVGNFGIGLDDLPYGYE